MKYRAMKFDVPFKPVLAGIVLCLAGCALITAPYEITKGAVQGGVWAVKTTYTVTAGTAKVIYKIGEFTYEVVTAPLEWPMTHDGIDSIDGLPPKEAIRLGRVKSTPYTVDGKEYHPLSVADAKVYREVGVASWYGYETRRKGGRMTANGEVFDPMGLTAAHKHLPLPMYAKVMNLENDRSIIVRVNDRGPFPSDGNPNSGERIIDLSLGAAKRLGFDREGTALVKVEAIDVREE